MVFFAILLAEIIVLFIFSQQLTKYISQYLLRITRNQHLTIQLLAFLFLPGVILHELAHFIVANILFVHTGEIEFFPVIQGDSVKLGSVAIAKTDPLRRFFIGIAPLLFGIGILSAAFYFFSVDFPGFNLQTLLLFYASFEIGNTMFSSKKDMEGSIVLLIGLVFFALAFWILGLRISLDGMYSLLNSGEVMLLSQKAIIITGIPLLLDGFILSVLGFFLKR